LLIIPGPASKNLGEKIAEILHQPIVNVESKIFPDGECYVRLTGDVKGERVVIVQSTYPPQNLHLVQLFLMVDTVKKLGAKEVFTVIPYMAYARQDKVFRLYEAVSIETILKILESLGVEKLITVNMHEPKVLQKFRFKSLNLSAVNVLAEFFLKLNLEKPVAFAPDEKAVKMVKEASQILGGTYGWFKKERDRITGEISMRVEKKFKVEGRDVVIFDDIISTGGTTATAVKMLKDMGARKVFSACVHPLLIGNAYQRILENGAEQIVGTDTLPSNVETVSVAPLIAKALQENDSSEKR